MRLKHLKVEAEEVVFDYSGLLRKSRGIQRNFPAGMDDPDQELSTDAKDFEEKSKGSALPNTK